MESIVMSKRVERGISLELLICEPVWIAGAERLVWIDPDILRKLQTNRQKYTRSFSDQGYAKCEVFQADVPKLASVTAATQPQVA
jgi:hypothetical protein